ncbi:hypothetical protein F2Q70_00044589 [Brassica cretica]|uniref:Uncharacterized protein n=1 Tax=Brassica cretica TaxID=69181 RepID=A0A8S9KCT8_BRACR|nr:hypothetical protein F2Q70_00044589 [Brassica cretica]
MGLDEFKRKVREVFHRNVGSGTEVLLHFLHLTPLLESQHLILMASHLDHELLSSLQVVFVLQPVHFHCPLQDQDE